MSNHLPPVPLRIETPPDAADERAMRAKLGAFNVKHAAIDQGQRIGIFQRDQAGEILAGIYGWLWGACLEIDCLWVDEQLRGQGAGRQLVQQIEQTAYQRGARQAILNTFSFQAPGFYQRLGYETFGAIEGYGGQHAKHFMRKDLV